jgi:hypothetical protein
MESKFLYQDNPVDYRCADGKKVGELRGEFGAI